MKRDQTAIEKCGKMLKRSTNAQIMQPNEFLEQLFREESEQEDTATSFPVSLILTPGASKERPWKGLVVCLPEK